MKRLAIVLALSAALSGAACGEITAFCMTAGMNTGVVLKLTTTPTGMKCSFETPVDSVPRPAPTSQTVTFEFTANN